MRVIGYIAAAILLFFGVIFIWGSFGSTPHPEWIVVGIVSVLIAFGFIWLVGRSPAKSVHGRRQCDPQAGPAGHDANRSDEMQELRRRAQA